MNATPDELWSTWRSSPDIRELAEAWITKPGSGWSSDDEVLYAMLHREPERTLCVMLAVMQLTDDQKVLGRLAAGPLEDFLGIHGRQYLEVFHALALEQRRLREVLDGVWQGAMPKDVWHRIETLKQKSFS